MVLAFIVLKRAARTFIRVSPFVFHGSKSIRVWIVLRVLTKLTWTVLDFVWDEKAVEFARKPRLWIVAPWSRSPSSLFNPSGSLSASSAGYSVCPANSISVLSVNSLEIICDMKAVKTLPKPPRSLPEISRTAGPVIRGAKSVTRSHRLLEFGVKHLPCFIGAQGNWDERPKMFHFYTQGRHQSFAIWQKQLLIGEPPKRKVCCRQGLRGMSTYRNRWPGRRLNQNGLIWGNAERYIAYGHKLKSRCASRLDAAPDISLRWSLADPAGCLIPVTWSFLHFSISVSSSSTQSNYTVEPRCDS